MSLAITSDILLKLYGILREYLDLRYMTPQDIEPDYSITSLSIQPGSKDGDNFLSAIYALDFGTVFKKKNISGDRRSDLFVGDQHGSKIVENFSLILKSQLTNNTATDSSRFFWNIIFTKERLIYSELFQGKLAELSMENIKMQLPPLAPKMLHFYSEAEEYSALLLDNLIKQGYYIPKSTGTGIKFEEATMVFKHIARLHALGIVLEAKVGMPLPAKYEYVGAEMMFGKALESVMQPFTQNSFFGVVKLAEKFRPDLVTQLTRINSQKTVWTRLCELLRPRTTRFSVLCHGDLRPNNIFLKRTEPEPICEEATEEDASNGNSNSEVLVFEGLRFIDFQMVRYAAAVTDLHYFLYSGGTSREFREANLDTLLAIYHEEFTRVLRHYPDVKLSSDVTNWGLPQLKAEFDAFNIFGLLTGLVFIPLIILKPGDIDKSIAEMSVEEREQFAKDDRRNLVFKLGSNYDLLRERLFEVCDEMASKGVI